MQKTNHFETQLTVNLVDYNFDYSEHKSKIRNLYYCITSLGIYNTDMSGNISDFELVAAYVKFP